MRLHTSVFGVTHTGTVLCHPLQMHCWTRAPLDGKRGRNPSQVHPWSVFSSKCPHSQKASVLLTDVSFPGMPEHKAAQEGGRRHWIARHPQDGDEPGHAGTPASSSAAAQTGKTLPPSKVFSSAQVVMVGDRKDTLHVQSTNHFTFCVSAVSSSPSLKAQQCLELCLQALR